MSFFSSTLILYDAYYVINDKETIGFNNDLGCEGRHRITQLDYLIEKIREAQNDAIAITERQRKDFKKWIEYTIANNLDIEKTPAPSNINMTEDESTKYQKLSFELELYTEHFYYIAFRLRTIFRNLPKLNKVESSGIRDVRNKLIEHPDKDKDSQIFIQSFGFGNTESGPVIKAIRYNEQTEVFPDKGLFINADELKLNLEKVLNIFLVNNESKKGST
jgi:hypothetical protein